MQTPVQIKSRSVLGVTDLTLQAPIKRELIPALDARSHKTRLGLLLKTLMALRVSSLEVEATPLIEDAIHRIRAIQSFRVAIVGDNLVLAVAFDGGWEPYMRRIWRDLGPLLDVIFCNCEGYLLSYDHSYAEYAGWVRSAQVETGFFYSASGLSVSDLYYLREAARREIDRHARVPYRPPTGVTLLTQSLPALTALYRLSEMYPPHTPDGGCLLRAALYLLPDLTDHLASLMTTPAGSPIEKAALCWFGGANAKRTPSLPNPIWNRANTQGGIVEPYPNLTHSCLVMVELSGAKAAVELLRYLRPLVTVADAQGAFAQLYVNLSWTVQGLRVAGVGGGAYSQLPAEFREGMAARAGILGDWFYNHPTRWSLPRRNWPASSAGLTDRVELSSVHAIVQFGCVAIPSDELLDPVIDDSHPLATPIQALHDHLRTTGGRILSVESMQRFLARLDPASAAKAPIDRFGFADGFSQPTLTAPPKGHTGYSDQVRLGDLLLGHPNSLDDPPLTGRLWEDSTFLVIRKLRQNVGAVNAMLKVNGIHGTADQDAAKAAMMGRRQDGHSPMHVNFGPFGPNPLPAVPVNSFDYTSDPDGARCPLHSHVRRANPRSTRPGDMPTIPRILRRGMSYGPKFPADEKEDGADRGLVFMAYNASIAEQFEVIQAWLSGGNSAGPHSYGALRDPYLGVARDDDPQTFVYNDGTDQRRLDLHTCKPFVQLEWGLYAFTPSIQALAELERIATEAARSESPLGEDSRTRKEDQRAIQRSIQAQQGAAVIAELRQLEQRQGFDAARERWKIALEDLTARTTGTSRNIWTAVRELHDGTLRTPYGVLVCSKKLVMEVFENAASRYTATGYLDRMSKSFGEIYLGMDASARYRKEAEPTNRAIMAIDEREAFKAAYEATEAIVLRRTPASAKDEATVEVRDFVDELLAALSHQWFGIPDDDLVMSGGWHWKPDTPPTCPGHFHAPSRYLFQPNPGPEATDIGERHGSSLKAAVRTFVERRRGVDPSLLTGTLSRALFKAIPNPADNERLVSTLVGVMMGFLPTVDGNLRATLYEWVEDKSLWDHQIAYRAHPARDSFDKAKAVLLPPLIRTMQLRPVPELTWRTALTPHRLGSTDVLAGDRVVVSIVSATQQCLIDDDPDLYPVFGGKRSGVNQPTHACPGYAMAMGVLLGTLAALMESVHLRPTLSPLALRWRRRRP